MHVISLALRLLPEGANQHRNGDDGASTTAATRVAVPPARNMKATSIASITENERVRPTTSMRNAVRLAIEILGRCELGIVAHRIVRLVTDVRNMDDGMRSWP